MTIITIIIIIICRTTIRTSIDVNRYDSFSLLFLAVIGNKDGQKNFAVIFATMKIKERTEKQATIKLDNISSLDVSWIMIHERQTEEKKSQQRFVVFKRAVKMWKGNKFFLFSCMSHNIKINKIFIWARVPARKMINSRIGVRKSNKI